MGRKPKTVRKILSSSDLSGYSPVSLDDKMMRDFKVFEGINSGLKPKDAMLSAGYRLPDKSAERMASAIHEKFNDKMRVAYDEIGLTARFIAESQYDIIRHGAKDSDRLKAVDQVLNVQGGYAPKTTDNNNVSFEKAVVEIGQLVNVNNLSLDTLRSLCVPSEIVLDKNES